MSTTAYKSQVTVDNVGFIEANESLFCTAICNFIKNGLLHNEQSILDAFVSIYRNDMYLVIEDNGIGLSQEKYDRHAKPLEEHDLQDGVGISISNAILVEHNFPVRVEETSSGTKICIQVKFKED